QPGGVGGTIQLASCLLCHRRLAEVPIHAGIRATVEIGRHPTPCRRTMQLCPSPFRRHVRLPVARADPVCSPCPPPWGWRCGGGGSALLAEQPRQARASSERFLPW